MFISVFWVVLDLKGSWNGAPTNFLLIRILFTFLLWRKPSIYNVQYWYIIKSKVEQYTVILFKLNYKDIISQQFKLGEKFPEFNISGISNV